ncbi:MAG TPA: histidine phosphatase family protein [Gaiellaceae bacterium]|nr:histidine phosphatase family protein [Gaiellaceae bacterium]
MTVVYLARHGQSDWNAEARWQGHADRPLTDLGRRQARELAERLADVELAAVYSSDLERARATAAAVARPRGLSVVTLPELREIDVGSWSGLTREEAEARFPDAFRRWADGAHGWDDGETYEQMTARVVGAVLGLGAAHPDASVLVVAHGGPIRALHATALGIDLPSHRKLRPVEPNARLSRLAVSDGLLQVLDHPPD